MYVQITDGKADVVGWEDLSRRMEDFPTRPTQAYLENIEVFPLTFEAPPDVDENFYSVEQGEPEETSAGWVLKWIVTPLPGFAEKQIAAIKAEASRRIEEIMPAHKQRNTLALGMEATTLHGPDPRQWPAEYQRAQADAMKAWAKIKAIRERSNELELNPPADVSDDRHWA